MAKKGKVWAARNKESKGYYVTFWSVKPDLDCDGLYDGGDDFFTELCCQTLAAVTGFKIKPGECVEVEIDIRRAGGK